jgi:acetyl/propionyl-CoA carboxylase alpha subunit
LLAKLIVWAQDRPLAIARMRRALAEYRVLGITTNLRLFDAIMNDPDFLAGHLHTGFLDGYAARLQGSTDKDDLLASVLAAASLEAPKTQPGPSTQRAGVWRNSGRQGLLR